MGPRSIILVTGANAGLGLEMIRALCGSNEDYEILLGGRSLVKAQQAADIVTNGFPLTRSKVWPIQVDIEDDQSIQGAFDEVQTRFGKLDALVNNAGAQFDQQYLDGRFTMRQTWNASWNVNTVGTQIMTATFVPLLLKSDNPRLLFMASGTSTLKGTENFELPINKVPTRGWPKKTQTPQNNIPAYRSSKCGMNMMMREWYRILKEDGVKVWCISPGFLATGLGGDQEANKRRGAGDPATAGQFVKAVLEGQRDDDVGRVLLKEGVQPCTSSQWKRSAPAAAAYEDEAIEGELEQEVYAEEPPSDSQINQAISHGPVTKFKDLVERGSVCQTVVDTLTKDMGLETMTQVQSLTLNESLKGADILAQARTGTGKTLAFLIPLLQNIINVDPRLEKRSRLGRSGSADDIRAIIISPTRELAEQIAVEARKVTKNTGVIVQTAVGGSRKAEGLRQIKREGCHILVGTPGRLNDVLSDPYSQVRAPNLSAFVLDEADRLLDQGFAPDIQAIQDLLPDRRERDRQTLLYSATVPREVMQVVRRTMKKDFQFVRTVQEGEQQTHEKVPQKLVNVGGFENLMPALVELCKREIIGEGGTTGSPARPFKAIVYFGATADVVLASKILGNLRHPGQSVFHQHPLYPAKIIEIHAKLSQGLRTRAAENFRRAASGILLSSDVTARGMDFPNVTHVIQIGVPPSEEQYVHRIGRTARGDKTGEGWLMITNFESREVRSKLRHMPLQQDNTLETAKVDMRKDAQLPEHTAKTLTQVQDATKMVPRAMKAASYVAALGVYQWFPSKQTLLDAMNDRAKYGWGMEEPPMVSGSLAGKLGLRRLQGINIGYEPEDDRGDGGARGGFRGSSIGGGARGGGNFDRGRSFGGGDRGGRSSFGGGDRGDRGGYGRSSFGGGDREGGRGSFPRGGGDRGDYGGGGGFGRREGGEGRRYGQ